MAPCLTAHSPTLNMHGRKLALGPKIAPQFAYLFLCERNDAVRQKRADFIADLVCRQPLRFGEAQRVSLDERDRCQLLFSIAAGLSSIGLGA